MNSRLLAFCFVWPLCAGSIELRPGTTFRIAEKMVTIQRVENLPYVQSEYTKRFHFDSADNPKLKELRERYHLDSVVAAGTNEFQRQILLNDWAHRQFKKFGRPSSGARGALQVLDGVQRGDSFFCAQYAEVLASAAASLGWNDRLLALRRHQGVNARGGSTEHTTTEIWSNQYGKWIMLDPTSNMYLERDGTPLNAWEIREEWFYRSGTNLTFVMGKERTRYRKKDLPIFLERFADFGDLTVDPDELDKYGFIGYIPNTNLMDAGNDYGQMFIVKDQLCAGTKWHERVLPKHPESEPYFPINQSAMGLSVSGDHLEVTLKTFTPNFRTFELRRDGGEWHTTPPNFPCELHEGSNVLEIHAVNQLGVTGPLTRVETVVHGNHE
jgi:hypothetical protein